MDISLTLIAPLWQHQQKERAIDPEAEIFGCRQSGTKKAKEESTKIS
jgi:hypothetical protein